MTCYERLLLYVALCAMCLGAALGLSSPEGLDGGLDGGQKEGEKVGQRKSEELEPMITREPTEGVRGVKSGGSPGGWMCVCISRAWRLPGVGVAQRD